MNETIDYYNKNAEVFFDSTVNADMSKQYHEFLKYLTQGAKILDFGCGSGRDSKFFLQEGYDVIAIDGSKKMCEKASWLIQKEVKCMEFTELNYRKEFDGIWACASLLHLEENELIEVFQKLQNALKDQGILYCSFKYGENALFRNGRYFTDMTEEKMNHMIEKFKELKIRKLYTTVDVRPGRENEMWLNAILQKNQPLLKESI